MASAVEKAVADGFTHVSFGDLFLEDIRRYREDRLAGTGLTPIFPLWGRPTAMLWEEMIDGGLDAYLTCLNPRIMPRELAGRRYDASLLATCRQASIRAASAASFTRARSAGRCSRSRYG